MALVILPSGSTSIDLQTVLDNAEFGDVIQLSGDVPFSTEVTVRSGLEVTIRSAIGSKWSMLHFSPDTRHFEITGSLILENVVVDGRGIGGGVHLTRGAFNIQHDAVIQNCVAENGGGLNIASGVFAIYDGDISTGLPLKGGEIRNNSATNGGGVYMTSGFINISSNTGFISGNVASGNGGGMFMNGGTCQLTGGEVNDNEAVRGGGVFLSGGRLNIEYGVISGNTTSENGGGVYVSSPAILEITGTVSSIINNTAGGNGGGVFTGDSTYSNLSTGSIIFRCNRAASAYAPPDEAATLYPRLLFSETTITGHILNNYDLSYTSGTPIDVTRKITYLANGGIGTHVGPSIAPCETDTVLSLEATGISYAGRTFLGWNTNADGSGVGYKPGDVVSLLRDMTLYAQWEVNMHTVTYHANGGTGHHVVTDIPYGTRHQVLTPDTAEIKRAGYIFTGWNTSPDGSGISYEPGYMLLITSDVTLYAQWRRKDGPDDKCLFCKKFCCEFSHEFSKELSRLYGCCYQRKFCEISYKISRQLCDELCDVPCAHSCLDIE